MCLEFSFYIQKMETKKESKNETQSFAYSMSIVQACLVEFYY